MTTLLSVLGFMGFYLLYTSSARVRTPHALGMEAWAQQSPSFAQKIGLGLLLLSAIISVRHWGIGSGIIGFFVLLMTVASLVIVLTPLRLVNKASVLTATLLLLIVELTLF